MLDLATVKNNLWELVTSTNHLPDNEKAKEVFFGLSAQLVTTNYMCYLFPMHRKVSACLNHLKDWKHSPDNTIPGEGLMFIKEAYWLLEQARKAEEYLYGAFFVNDLSPFEAYIKLSNRLLATDYGALLPNVAPRVYAGFMEFRNMLSEKLSHIHTKATKNSALVSVRVLDMVKNFKWHITNQKQLNAQQWEREIAKRVADEGEDEKYVVEMLIDINERHISQNYWGKHYPLHGETLNQFIIYLRENSGNRRQDELVALFKLLGEKEYLILRDQQPKRQAKPMTFTPQEQKILNRAAEADLYAVKEGVWVWQKTDALHDYFLGKLMCGDRTIEAEGKHEWYRLPGSRLPTSKLKEYFCNNKIGATRNTRSTSPADYGIIDALFKNLKYDTATKAWVDKYNP